MKKLRKILLGLIIILALVSCKDEELSLTRKSYFGNELRTDGYYYKQWDNSTTVQFLYRNGIILNAHAYNGLDLNIVEKEMFKLYNTFYKDKIGWGVFQVFNNKVDVETWTTSVGGGLPVYKWQGLIENDTTFREIRSGDIYHFRQFSPKPDSSIAKKWIK